MSAQDQHRMPTGVTGVDTMLHGGLIPGRPYVVAGGHGTGKTTFCVQFLQQGVRQGERALFVAIDEPPAELRENVRFLGWDVGKIRILDVHPAAKAYSRKVSLVEVAAQRSVGSLREARADSKTETMKQMSPDLSPQSLQLMLRQELQEVKYSRLVIDSLTSLKGLSGGEEDIDTGIVSLLRFLSEANLTSLLVTDFDDPEALEPEMFLSRGIIRFHKVMTGSKMERCVWVEKFRGSAHDTQPRPMMITKSGITVESEKKVGKQVQKALTSVPHDL
ncbi:MAG: KaiC protein [Candidatus Thermoplasmatota archaeon]|nr:KaiC protein [Candidatus Thermoplasmatota archaeon]